MSAYAATTLHAVFDAIDKGVCISSLIAGIETQAGNTVVRPGDADWLPKQDWEPGTCCSVTSDGIARLVLLHAKVSGAGAFARLVEGVHAAKLIPHVIAPTSEFAQTLNRHGWRAGLRGTRDGQEHVWTQRRRAGAAQKPRLPMIEIQTTKNSHSLRFSLGSIAELESFMDAGALDALVERLEAHRLRARDVIRIIGCGLRGAGHPISDDEVAQMEFVGGLAEAHSVATFMMREYVARQARAGAAENQK